MTKESTVSVDIDRVEVVVDDQYPSRVAIYMLDDQGNRLEGGSFDKNAFMDWVLEFYNKNF
jgi:hypothetical protein